MKETDFYWLVGLLEGEGSFMKGSPSSPNMVKISLQMTDEDVIKRVSCLFGRKYHKIYAKNTKHKDSYSVCITGTKALELMKLMQSHMSLRRKEQIQKALDSYDPLYKNKIVAINAKLKEDVVLNAWYKVRNNEVSLRQMARELNVNHESLRQRFLKLDTVV